MRFEGREFRLRDLLSNAWHDILTNHTMAMAAGLSYYFVLSLFPLLILAAALLAYLPIPNLFAQILALMARVVPRESMGLVRKVIETVVQPHGGLVTFGIVGTIWSASSGFAGLIEALNVAYDVPETRPVWRTRLVALELMVVTGTLLLAAMLLLLVGPKAAIWIFKATHIPNVLWIWPYIKWSVSVAFTVLAVELLFYWAPNVKQRFWATLPGALIGVGFFIGGSYGLGLYFQRFANYNKTYGTLGAAMALMVWMYYSWFAILVGAELNSELVKAGGGGKLELKARPPEAVKPVQPWEERPAA